MTLIFNSLHRKVHLRPPILLCALLILAPQLTPLGSSIASAQSLAAENTEIDSPSGDAGHDSASTIEALIEDVEASTETVVLNQESEVPQTQEEITDSGRFHTLEMDWRSLDQLSVEQRRTLKPGCSGAYIDPLATPEQTNDVFLLGDVTPLGEAPIPTDQQPLYIEAGSALVTDGKRALLQDNVQISQGQRSIRADSISYDRDIDEIQLEGGVLIRQPGMLVAGEKAKASTAKNTASFERSAFVSHETHMRGEAESIRQIGPGQIILQNGSLTSCEPGSDAWSLSGGELGINQETGQGYGKNVKLKIGSVPIFYIPYLSFPIGDQRQSGFLFPAISSSEDGGIDIAVPYYWNLAENYDATITPRIITERGLMLETEFRHLTKLADQEVYTALGLAYLPNDSGGADQDIDALVADGTISAEEATPNKGSDRWLLQFQQQAGSNEGWYTESDYTKVSDFDYLRDLGTSSLYAVNTTYLDQRATAGYVFENWNVSAQFQDYQVLLADVDSPYRKLPQIDANGYYEIENDHFGTIQAKLDNQYTYFDNRQNTTISGDVLVTGQRLTTDYRLSKKLSNTWGYFKSELGYKTLNYKLNDGGTGALENTSINLNTGQLVIDTGVAFEHAEGDYLQTFEPRLYYTYREFADHTDLYNVGGRPLSVNFDTSLRTFSYDQLYRDSRFSGSDRLDDAHRITLGVTTRWISNTTGLELGTLSFGQINHLRDRRVGLNNEIPSSEDTSQLALNGNIAIGPLANAYMSAIYDTSNEKIERFATGFSVKTPNQGTLFNAFYTFARQNPESIVTEEIDQIDLSLITQINRQWAVMGLSLIHI